MEYRSMIAATLAAMDEWELVSMWNEYTQAIQDYDSEIFPMEELDDLLYGKKPSEIIELLTKDFDYRENWLRFSIWGMESSDCARGWMDMSEMIDYILENADCLYNDDIRQILAEKSDKEQETA